MNCWQRLYNDLGYSEEASCRPLMAALSDLDSTDFEILTYRYGLITGKRMSAESVGTRFGLSRHRVLLVCYKALQAIQVNLSTVKSLRKYQIATDAL